MKISLNCIPCFIKQALNTLEVVKAPPQSKEQALRKVLHFCGEMDLSSVPPPTIGKSIQTIIQNESKIDDPYQEVKKEFNLFALQLYPELQKKINQSKDPLETAIKLAIAGNIIDFGVQAYVQKHQVHASIDSALDHKLDKSVFHNFCRQVEKAKRILYLGDNAGEILFDRLLIEFLPSQKIIFVVRGKPILNDALFEDADLTGLTDIVSVIDNGDNTPGTYLKSCSQSFIDLFEKADLIISKGQGNFETLNEVKKNIFFLFKAKCQVVADYIGCEVGSILFLSPEKMKKRILE